MHRIDDLSGVGSKRRLCQGLYSTVVALRTTTRRGCSFVANSFETSAQGTQRDDGVIVATQTQVASGLASEATGL